LRSKLPFPVYSAGVGSTPEVDRAIISILVWQYWDDDDYIFCCVLAE
jgi:hypothetical protein